ncbi:MAG: HEPN domain-containing protein [Rickettsiaceae bacterium]
MKTTLTHLPKDKLSYVQEVADVIITEMKKSKQGLVYLILFGSYARGDWVFERGYDEEEKHNYTYISDLDLLIVTEQECHDNSPIIKKTKRKLPKVNMLPSLIELPDVSIIVHTVEHFNSMLEDNSYFFNDIKKEGVLLYDSGQYPMANPKSFTQTERKAKAIEGYEEWFGQAKSFLNSSLNLGPSEDRNIRRIRAFMLHQACENAFVAANLVFNDDRRKLHDLIKLEKEVARIEPEFLRSFPKQTKRNEHIFRLILKAYIDARYKKYYQVTEEELREMTIMVQNFHNLVERLCQKKIESL